MRVAIIGAGSIGQRHARDAAALGHDVLRYDVLRERSDVATVAELWAWEPDAAVICTWPDSHVEWAFEAARRGCNLFVEKPLALSMEHIDKLRTFTRYQITHVACPLRYVDVLRELHADRARYDGATITAGYPLATVTPGYRTSYHASTGVLLDIGSHALDLLQWFFGPAYFQSCEWEYANRLGLPCDSYTAMTVVHSDGRRSDLSVDWLMRRRKWNVHMHGSGGVGDCDVPANIDSAYRAEMAAFLAACEAGVPADNPLDEAAGTLRTLLEARAWAEQSQ
jgi:predicted dehydrogenase